MLEDKDEQVDHAHAQTNAACQELREDWVYSFWGAGGGSSYQLFYTRGKRCMTPSRGETEANCCQVIAERIVVGQVISLSSAASTETWMHLETSHFQ